MSILARCAGTSVTFALTLYGDSIGLNSSVLLDRRWRAPLGIGAWFVEIKCHLDWPSTYIANMARPHRQHAYVIGMALCSTTEGARS